MKEKSPTRKQVFDRFGYHDILPMDWQSDFPSFDGTSKEEAEDDDGDMPTLYWMSTLD